MSERARAAILTVGTELVRGLSVDTNSAEIARALHGAGLEVVETVSLGDDAGVVAAHLRRLTASCAVVVVTGGLGPTHDDITRQAAADALGLTLVRDPGLERGLRAAAARHTDPRGSEQVLRQADVLAGARVLPAVLGTAPGQVIDTPGGSLVLLPGPPREMRPLLATFVGGLSDDAAAPVTIGTHGLPESEVQLRAQDAIGDAAGVELTVLAKPGDVRAVLFDRGVGAQRLQELGRAVAEALGDAVYATDGSTLAEAVVALAAARSQTIATAESCTGGLVAGAITDVPGASAVFRGGVVAYSDAAKTSMLAVDPDLIRAVGAVSEPVAREMAAGAVDHIGADIAVSVTGIAGPDGGSAAKPVGTVWFALCTQDGTQAFLRTFPGDRETVRTRAVATALDLLRRALAAG